MPKQPANSFSTTSVLILIGIIAFIYFAFFNSNDKAAPKKRYPTSSAENSPAMNLAVIFNNGIADENLEQRFQSYLTDLKKYYPASTEQNIADGVYTCYKIMLREGGTDTIFDFLDEFKAYTITSRSTKFTLPESLTMFLKLVYKV